MPKRLAKLNQKTLRDQIVDAIRDAIIQGTFKAGEKIPEQDLAEHLGVSRTPIREAIRILEQQGLLETRPKTGTYVASLDWEVVQDSLQVRMALEEFAVRQAIQRLNQEEWRQLCDHFQRVYDEMGEAIARDDPVATTELDIEWHTRLIDAARNSYLSRTWRSSGLMYLVWSPERELYPFSQQKWSVFRRRHLEFLEALRQGDPDKCAAAVRDHIAGKLSDMAEWLKKEAEPV
ncbi:MAG: GntR family transcriptional regulator [Chloroflexi bacterium]|nr:GntR family transcriptional regulator [Chloroflexota bacterium]